MCHRAFIFVLSATFAVSAIAQITGPVGKSKTAPHVETLPPASKAPPRDRAAFELLRNAEAESAALDQKMRAWALWQIGMLYQTRDRVKARELFENALVAARATQEDSPHIAGDHDPVARITGHPSLSPEARLQADIAQSLLVLDPDRADEVLEKAGPPAREAVLLAVLSSQEKQKQFGQALATLQRISAESEMPYEHAMRLMDTLKPEQSGELLRVFSAALASYRDHGPHTQFWDEFPVMLSRYWKRLPKEVVQQAMDEVLKQAATTEEQVNYSVPSDKGTVNLRTLYEYRLSQMMLMLRDFDPSAARRYEEKYPVLESVRPLLDHTSAPAGNALFRPSRGYGNIMLSAVEMPLARKAAATADAGHMTDAMSQASGITDANLRAQTYEYIARASAKKKENAASDAIRNMLNAAEHLRSDEGLTYYNSAAEINLQMGQTDDAKKNIELGLKLADRLYQIDSDDDDPNTALKAFWPSTEAYRTMLHSAAKISHTWAVSLLEELKDQELKVAAEIALAAGWLDAPSGPKTVVVTKKSSNSSFFSGRE